jgi:hypothetical protein
MPSTDRSTRCQFEFAADATPMRNLSFASALDDLGILLYFVVRVKPHLMFNFLEITQCTRLIFKTFVNSRCLIYSLSPNVGRRADRASFLSEIPQEGLTGDHRRERPPGLDSTWTLFPFSSGRKCGLFAEI